MKILIDENIDVRFKNLAIAKRCMQVGEKCKTRHHLKWTF
jgi:hypothetical protein